MPGTKGRASPPWKNFLPPEKISWTYCMHNHCFRCYMLCNALLHVINVKFGLPSENYLSPLVSQAGYGSAGDCCLWRLSVMSLNSVFSQSNFSGLTSNINRRNHRCRSKQVFGGAKHFCPNFPKLAWKAVFHLLWTVFWCDLQKMVFTCFPANLGRYFCPDFQGFCIDI